MTDVLGLPFALAKTRLEAEGYAVETLEVRSRKGVPGNEYRVVKQTELDGRRVMLQYACFQTDADKK